MCLKWGVYILDIGGRVCGVFGGLGCVWDGVWDGVCECFSLFDTYVCMNVILV